MIPSLCHESSMAEGVPLFHNFFETFSPLEEDSKQLPLQVPTENPLELGKNSVLTEEVGQEGQCLGIRQSSSMLDESASASSPQRSLHLDMDARDSSRPFKKSRVESLDDIKRGQTEALMDGLILTMQPPRILSKPSNLHPSLTSNLDGPAVISKAWDYTTPASLGLLGPSWTGQKGVHADNRMTSNLKDSIGAPVTHVPPADEGSRTGLKGSSVGSLLNQAMAGGPGLSLGRLKSSSHDATSESTFITSQDAAPITRQLTIFYSGQAHVFEDVSSEKAEAIMTLARSNGRSWSTVYNPRPKSGIPLSASERSVSTFEKERAQGGSKPSPKNPFKHSLSASTEIQTAFSVALHKANRMTEIETTTDHIGVKLEAQTRGSVRTFESEKECEGRS